MILLKEGQVYPVPPSPLSIPTCCRSFLFSFSLVSGACPVLDCLGNVFVVLFDLWGWRVGRSGVGCGYMGSLPKEF